MVEASRDRFEDERDRADIGRGVGVVADRADRVIALLLKHIPGVAPLGAVVGGELSVRLPMGQSSAFPGMLRDLEENRSKLSVSEFGLSVTTMDEVFRHVTGGSVTGKGGEKKVKVREAAALGGGTKVLWYSCCARFVSERSLEHIEDP